MFDEIFNFLRTKLLKTILGFYIIQSLTIFYSFLQLFLVSRELGIEKYGELSIILSLVSIFSSLFTARSNESIAKFYIREVINSRYENALIIIVIGIIIDLITTVLFFTTIFSASKFLVKFFLKKESLQIELILYSLVTSFDFLKGTMVGFLQAKKDFNVINLINFIDCFMKIVTIIFVFYYFKDLSLKTVIISLLTVSFLSFVYTSLTFLKRFFQEFKGIKLSFNKKLFLEYFSFNIKTFISSSLKAGNNNIDNLILGYFLNSSQVGIYQAIKKILYPLNFITGPFAIVFYPDLISYFENKKFNKILKLISKITKIILTFAFIYFFIVTIFFDYIIYYIKIEESLEKLFILLILIFLLNLFISTFWWARIFSNVVNPNYSLYMNFFATFYQLSITLLATKIYNIEGLVISMIFMHFIIDFYYYRKLKYINNKYE